MGDREPMYGYYVGFRPTPLNHVVVNNSLIKNVLNPHGNEIFSITYND